MGKKPAENLKGGFWWVTTMMKRCKMEQYVQERTKKESNSQR